MNKIIALVSTLLLLPYPTLALEIASNASSQPASESSYCQIEAESEELSEKQLQSLAHKITVKVTGDNNGGSGTLLAKQGNSYLVLTNAHVVRGVNSISLQTADGKTYPAEIVKQTNFEKSDLALLKFQSSSNYCVVEVGEVPDKDAPVLAAGFSGEKGEIVFRTGEVKQVLGQSLKDGYQIGYSSDIEQGMSGGPIINSLGMIVGLNGRGAYPILNSGYVYQNGSRPSEAEIQEMRKLSWGIPASTFLAQVNGEILTAYGLPLPANSIEVPQTQLTGWLGELKEKAKKFTVRIDDSKGGNGSGVIIAKNGNTYTVLTVAHVFSKAEDATKPCDDCEYKIMAHDGNKYPVEKSTIKREEGVDLAIVKFSSEQIYQVATLANSNPNNNHYVFTGGYPKLENNYSPWRFTLGKAIDNNIGLFLLKDSDFSTINLGGLKSVGYLTGGYELIYTSITYRGMSGGPVLDSIGRVIGIHGRAEGEEAFDEKKEDRASSDGKVHLGFSLGIPVSTFLGIAPRLQVKAQNLIIDQPVLPLDAQKIQSIEKAVLTSDIPKGNANATVWLERGNQLWRLGRNEEAIQVFDKVINLNPSFVYLAHYGKALALIGNGNDQEVLNELKKAIQYKPDFTAAISKEALTYINLNQWQQALVATEKLIKLEPNNPIGYILKSLALNSLERQSESIAAATKAIELHSNIFWPYIGRGNLYISQGNWNLAFDDFNKALTINPHSDDAYIGRSFGYISQQKFDLALVDINKVFDIDQNSGVAYMIRAMLYTRQNKLDLALADVNQLFRIYPNSNEGYMARGILYAQQQKWDLALVDLNKALKITPNSSVLYLWRGIVYAGKQQLDLALIDFNKAIETNPNDIINYIFRGRFYIGIGKFDLAVADINKALIINSNSSDALAIRASVYVTQGAFDLAFVDASKALQINPYSYEAYVIRSMVYAMQEKLQLAFADANKAIEINPYSADAYAMRGTVYAMQKQWQLAIVDANKAIEINPNSAEAYLVRASVHNINEDKPKAIQDLQQAAQLFQSQGNTAGYEQAINLLKSLQ